MPSSSSTKTDRSPCGRGSNVDIRCLCVEVDSFANTTIQKALLTGCLALTQIPKGPSQFLHFHFRAQLYDSLGRD